MAHAPSIFLIMQYYQQVKYYSAEDWETGKYEEAIDIHQVRILSRTYKVHMPM